jgi:hypothetical protein
VSRFQTLDEVSRRIPVECSGSMRPIGGPAMTTRPRSGRPAGEWALLPTVVVLALPAGVVRAAEPLEVIREAFRASSQGLTSGIGKGAYRHYRARGDDDWQLKQDADLTVYFDGKKYHIDLAFHRDDLREDDARRIIYDGEAVTEAWFTPAVHPAGAQAYVSSALQYDGLNRPWNGIFRWDVAQLSRNVWDLERSTRKAGAGDLEIAQTTDGDLILTHRLIGRDWIRAKCPRRSGYNIARLQHFNERQNRPAREVRIEWKQGPGGLWYVRWLDETQVLRDAKGAVWRTRDVVKYTEFEPNAKVDPKRFTEESLGLPARSRILDGRPGARGPERRVP